MTDAIQTPSNPLSDVIIPVGNDVKPSPAKDIDQNIKDELKNQGYNEAKLNMIKELARKAEIDITDIDGVVAIIKSYKDEEKKKRNANLTDKEREAEEIKEKYNDMLKNSDITVRERDDYKTKYESITIENSVKDLIRENNVITDPVIERQVWNNIKSDYSIELKGSEIKIKGFTDKSDFITDVKLKYPNLFSDTGKRNNTTSPIDYGKPNKNSYGDPDKLRREANQKALYTRYTHGLNKQPT